ncbi:low molecular weight protein arginine phosphatase [Alkalibaculum bacchi]|uniref:low molecular weight protein arginine phosphatase n=1 Tax=Alkalibaculum bacchi TaxID=645887 RepID=UPI0026EB7CB9|nr:low molecular weight protein arginine phosphatase [Alkalibaculum bacchi]
MKMILFVCTGNTCRSSMAEGIMKDLLKDKDIIIKSAGTDVFFSEPANQKAIDIMSQMDVDIKNHLSQMLTEELIEEADLILTMTHYHTDNVIRKYAKAIEKTFTLKEYLSLLLEKKGRTQDPDYQLNIDQMSLADPYGQSIDVYRDTAKEIKRILERIVEMIF